VSTVRRREGEGRMLLVAHRDRLAQFGLDRLNHAATNDRCEILVANQGTVSPYRQMVEDLFAVVHTVSCRPCGLRRYEKPLQDDRTRDAR
jgi:putative resolvase